MEIQLTGMGNYAGKCIDLLRNFMNDTFRCSRATQVLEESPETVNLTEFCPILYNEQFKLLAFTLDAQTHKTTIQGPCFHSGCTNSQDNNQT